MKISRVRMKNFRGAKDATYEFSDKTRIKGCNGSGKSTIVSAILWILVDKDYSLTSNPPVRNINALDEEVVSVTIDMTFGDKPVQVQKSQKLKRSKNGTVSLTNSYMVNSVPKSEKAFREYLTDIGFDFDKFLPCCHPGMLLSGINNKKERTALRNMLFEMASDITDLDVASKDPELAELAILLKDYDTEEIAAIQNNTLRVIRENYGKDGEILRAKIEGLADAKVEVDVNIVQSKIDDCDLRLAEVEGTIKRKHEEFAEKMSKSSELMDKRFALSKMEEDANKEMTDKKSDLRKDIFEMEYKIKSLNRDIELAEISLKNEKANMKETEEKMTKNRAIYERSKEFKVNDSLLNCPTCGQKLPEKKAKQIIKSEQKKHDDRMKAFEDAIKTQESSIAASAIRIDGIKDDIKAFKDSSKKLSKELDKKKSELAKLESMPKADVSKIPGYKKLEKEIFEMEESLPKTSAPDVYGEEVRKREIQIERSQYQKELSKAENNKDIDSKIEKLRDNQVNYEQKKADAEMILDQLNTLSMKKNQLLQDSVNENFSLVKWKLFEVLKNGTFRDACIPTIDGKAFGESMNTGLETMAKIDAMNGIQKFYGFDYPIFLDNAEHLDKWSLAGLQTDHQLIVLTVTDDEKLTIE